jgi:hypothetical protein
MGTLVAEHRRQSPAPSLLLHAASRAQRHRMQSRYATCRVNTAQPVWLLKATTPIANSSKLPAARQIRGELPGCDGGYSLFRFVCEPIVAHIVGILWHKLNAYFCRLEPECMQGCSWRHCCNLTQTTHRAEAPLAGAYQPGFLCSRGCEATYCVSRYLSAPAGRRNDCSQRRLRLSSSLSAVRGAYLLWFPQAQGTV